MSGETSRGEGWEGARYSPLDAIKAAIVSSLRTESKGSSLPGRAFSLKMQHREPGAKPSPRTATAKPPGPLAAGSEPPRHIWDPQSPEHPGVVAGSQYEVQQLEVGVMGSSKTPPRESRMQFPASRKRRNIPPLSLSVKPWGQQLPLPNAHTCSTEHVAPWGLTQTLPPRDLPAGPGLVSRVRKGPGVCLH